MTTIIQFSWTRLDGLGLIVCALGWGFLAQLPILYFTLTILYLNLETYFVAVFGTIIGSSIILSTITCSLAEDWNESTNPNLIKVVNFSFLFTSIFACGFFLYFFVEQFFPSDFSELVATQRYFSGMAIGLILVGITAIILYKTKHLLVKQVPS